MDHPLDYDTFSALEHHGEVVVLVNRDGERSPLSFRRRRDARAWFERAHQGNLARRDELNKTRELARLGAELSTLSERPWSSPAHLSAVLLSTLSDAGVSSASLERSDQGVSICYRRFGHLQLGGSLALAEGQSLIEHLQWHLHGANHGLINIEARFPGPPLQAWISKEARGITIKPHPVHSGFSDLGAWGMPHDDLANLRDMLTSDTGLLLVLGRSDSGKSTLAALSAQEANIVRREHAELIVMDELSDRNEVLEALKRAQTNLVLATIRAEDAEEGAKWLSSLGVGSAPLKTCLKGAIETRLLPVQCAACAGEGCAPCHGSGIAHRRSQSAVVRLSSMLQESETFEPFERERRKLTA